MDFLTQFRIWRDDPFFDTDTRAELKALDEVRDAREIEDRFYRDLSFGTGGLRGIMGAGTNRMNRYTVGRATLGFANYLRAAYPGAENARRGVVIAHDTRHHSEEFARLAADVLSARGLHVYLLQGANPTPLLSFAVREKKALAGIVITASHNPKEYNGYKVYDEYGCQLVPRQAERVSAYIDLIRDFKVIPQHGNRERVEALDLTDAFISAVLRQSRLADSAAKAALKIVYTPLHGAGKRAVCGTLSRDGFTNVTLVPEQTEPDGDFPTVASPNPEERGALQMGLALAEKTGADIALGTDPDSDRLGVGVRTADGSYRLLTGNQLGALLTDFVLSHTDLTSYPRPAVVKTEVTGDLGAEIAKSYGVNVFSTLTGFKYIGEKMTEFDLAAQNGDDTRAYQFLCGYEESYGFLCGTHARDKDAVVSAMLLCELAAACKARCVTLLDRLSALYDKYGYYYDALESRTLSGKDGLAQIAAIMTAFRTAPPAFVSGARCIDYLTPVEQSHGFGLLPKSDVLKYIWPDGSWLAVRPSGTEPKIKFYYSLRAENEASARERFDLLRAQISAACSL